MPWNNGGQGSGPWGSNDGAPGGGQRKPPGGPSGGGPFGGGPFNNGPSGGGPFGGLPPDLDQIIARIQAWLRGLLPRGRAPGRSGLLLVVIAVVAVWLATGFYRVQPDEQGVVLRFGAFVGTTLPGLNYHLPWPIEEVERPAVTRINRIEIGFRSSTDVRGLDTRIDGSSASAPRDGPNRDVPEESLMLTGDENIIDIDFSVFWRIRSASDFLFNTRRPATTVKSAAESVMREVIGSIPIQPALAEARARVETDVLRGTQAILDQYGAGVEITQVQLQKVDPPAAVIDSFRDVQRANTDADRARNEAQSYANDIVPRARGDSAAIVAQADGARQAGIAEATGQAQRFLSVLTAYQAAKDVTLRRLYIETMQEILTKSSSVIVDDRLRGLVPFLPLGDTPPPSPPLPGAPAAGAPAR